MMHGGCSCGFNTAGVTHDLDDFRKGIPLLLPQYLCDTVPLGRGSRFHRMQERQGDFSLSEVVTDIFPCLRRVARVVEQVVRQLKRNAQIHTVVIQPVCLVSRTLVQ